MAKYVIEIPDEVKWIQYIQQTKHGTQNLKVESVYNLTPYTEPDEQSVKNNNIHLCWSCQNSSECHVKVKDVLFGDDVGNDNICCCNAYRPTESNASDEQEIRQEVWEFARKITVPTTYGNGISIPLNDLDKIYGTCSVGNIMNDNSYSEAKAKYDAWKKQKDEIHVGDEVIYHRNKYIVGYVGEDEVYHLVDQCWIRAVVQGNYQLTKTGRHFDEVDELLKKMRETDEIL